MTAARTLRFALDRFRFSNTLTLLEYWLSKQPERSGMDASPLVPADFDPVDVPTLLPYLYLLEKRDNRLRYRVSGETVNQLFGQQHTGAYLDTVIPPKLYPIVVPHILRVLDGAWLLLQGHVTQPEKKYVEFERLFLPVRRKSGIQVLGCQFLSITANYREDPPPLQRPDHYNFYSTDLHSGAMTESWHMIEPIMHTAIAC